MHQNTFFGRSLLGAAAGLTALPDLAAGYRVLGREGMEREKGRKERRGRKGRKGHERGANERVSEGGRTCLLGCNPKYSIGAVVCASVLWVCRRSEAVCRDAQQTAERGRREAAVSVVRNDRRMYGVEGPRRQQQRSASEPLTSVALFHKLV